MELEGKSVEDRIAPNVFELGVVESGGRGIGISSSAGSYHPYHQYQQSKVSSSYGSGRSSRRRSLPPSPFTNNTTTTTSSTAITTNCTEDASLLETLRHPQQQQQQHHHMQQQQAPVKNSRKMRRYNKKLGKRLRRATQAAPNNNNEFLMQEHDPLYHLDGDHATEEDSNSDEQNLEHPDMHQHRSHRYSSSPEEDEEDFLTRDFSNAYEVVHAERLYSMSKNQLIHEYQLMEERVEFLESKLRSALLERESRNDMVKSEAIPVPLPTGGSKRANNDSLLSSSQSSLVEDDDEDRFQFIYT